MWRILTLLIALPAVAAGDVMPHDTVLLLGQWTFDKGDARDSSGRGGNGVCTNMKFDDGCAVFDGTGHIEFTVGAAELKYKLRTVEIEIRAKLDHPEAYYNTLVSHPFFQVAVHSLGSGQGRPCFAFSTLKSDLAPDEVGGEDRWGKGPRLAAATKDRFYYWGWIGDGSAVIPAPAWVTLRTVYDGKQVTQYLDKKLVGTHPTRDKGAFVAAPEGVAGKGFIGKAISDVDSQHLFSGRIDSIKIRGKR